MDCFTATPYSAIPLGFPSIFHIQAKAKMSNIKFNVSPQRLEPITMQLPNQYQTIMPIHVSC